MVSAITCGGVFAIHWVSRDVLEARVAEHLQEHQRFVAEVLDVVSVREGHVADVPGLEVERPGRS